MPLGTDRYWNQAFNADKSPPHSSTARSNDEGPPSLLSSSSERTIVTDFQRRTRHLRSLTVTQRTLLTVTQRTYRLSQIVCFAFYSNIVAIT